MALAAPDNASSRVGRGTTRTQSRLELPGFTLTEGLHRSGAHLPWHDHAVPTICFVLSGAFDERWRGGSLLCVPSTLKITPAGERHCDHFRYGDVRGLLVEIDPVRMGALHPVVAVLEQRICSQDGIVAALARRMRLEMSAPDAATPLVLEGLLLELIAAAFRWNERLRATQPPRWLVRARQAAEQEHSARITLSGLAAEAGVHPVTLARAFRRAYGQTVGEYVRQVRIDRAGRQLIETDLPIAQIALMNGFADQSHLSTLFRRRMGVSPSAYRRLSR